MIDIAIPSSSWNFPKAIATALPNTIKSIHAERIGNANESITELVIELPKTSESRGVGALLFRRTPKL